MNSTAPSTAVRAWLVPIAGPAAASFDLVHDGAPLIVGRQENCDLVLPQDSVSRRHARLRFDGVQWRVADLGSRWGTLVNGVALAPQRETPLADGDLLVIAPFTFRFSLHPLSGGLLQGAVAALDDRQISPAQCRTLAPDRVPSLGEQLLGLLLESAGRLHEAEDESALAAALLEAARRGSGMPNGAVLKPAGDAGQVVVLAPPSDARSPIPTFSRTLLSAAAAGDVAELTVDAIPADISRSIAAMGVRRALCAPILLGQTVAAYLYLDWRGESVGGVREGSTAFCLALARIAGLALGNLKRMEMDARDAALQADLDAAAAAQQCILPPPHGRFARFAYWGRSQPGECMSGDFFEVYPLDEERLAVAIGDVSGHGVAASVLMTASAGYLRAALQRESDPPVVVRQLNEFVCTRTAHGKFMTLWLGVIDLARRALTFVDAGHGFAMLGQAGSAVQKLPGGDQIPLGIEPAFVFQACSCPLPEAGRLLLLSDGVIEQATPTKVNGKYPQFGVAGVERACGLATGGDALAALFDALTQHAGQTMLDDDATAVVVQWPSA